MTVIHGTIVRCTILGANIALATLAFRSGPPPLAAMPPWVSAPRQDSIPAATPRDSAAQAAEFTPVELKQILQHSPLKDPPPDPTNKVADSPAAARLGQFLFFEKRLSGNHTLSCSSCHDSRKALTDGKPLGEGLGKLERRTLSLLNVAYNRWFFWDGRADSLWSQALQPLEHPLEMGGTRLQIAHLIASDHQLKRAYQEIFGPMPDLSDAKHFPARGRPADENVPELDRAAWQSMTDADRDAVNRIFSNVGKAFAAYERRLVARKAPFDVFVDGLRSNDAEKQRRLPDAARRGLRLFIGRGNCRLCHSGPTFSDGEFHDLGVPPRSGELRDAGRFAGIAQLKQNPFNCGGPYSDDPTAAAEKLATLVSRPENWGQFKTPSLRNVAIRAPYMHQGQFASLRDVLHYYSLFEDEIRPPDHQRESILAPLALTDAQAADLIAFLESLTDTSLPSELLTQPDSPTLLP